MTLAISPREALNTLVLGALGVTLKGVEVQVETDTDMFRSRCEVGEHPDGLPHSAAEIRTVTTEYGVQYDMVCGACITPHLEYLDMMGDLDPHESIDLKVSAWYLRYAHQLDV